MSEWLEPDGLGGFASGTVALPRTRRYHALLLVASAPPVGRRVLVNGFDAAVETAAGAFAISSQRYAPDVLHPDGARRVARFAAEPWPRWTFRLEDGSEIEQEILVPRGEPRALVRWRRTAGSGPARLTVRPFLSGRDDHALHHENPAFRADPEIAGGRVSWRPYPGVPGVVAAANGAYAHEPFWYRGFLYEEESARGLDCTEDLLAPGAFRFDLERGPALLLLTAEGAPLAPDPGLAAFAGDLFAAEERRRARFATPLHRAADAYIVRRGAGKTIVAGYPWFGDWGRDTFIALRGLALATGRLDDARAILLEWAGTISEGMLPNRFPDRGEPPEFNSVDASLWFCVAVHDLLSRAPLPPAQARPLVAAVQAIVDGYAAGTRFGIHMDDDGLLLAGDATTQLTWMDARAGGRPVTPRSGKPVEVEALWVNALAIAGRAALAKRATEAFRGRFWNETAGCLYDVIDPAGREGTVDATLRPNQIFAVGGLPLPVLEGERARRVVDAVEARLLTPLGLRTLAPGLPGYAARYEGGCDARDAAYHQGTVWPWLMGPFVEAWVRVRGGAREARREARARFLDPLLAAFAAAGPAAAPEIADADPPHAPRGCPFQAWSQGEVNRLALEVLADT